MSVVATVPVTPSGSAFGAPILIAATGTPGTLLHSTISTFLVTVFDEIWVYFGNTDTTDRKVTVEWGGTTSPNNLIEFTVPAESGLMLSVPGIRLTGTGAAVSNVRAFAATANVITALLNVNRMTVS